MSYRGFPVREYVEHLITDEILSVSDILQNTDALDEMLVKMKQLGLTEDDITKEMLLEKIDSFSKEKLFSLVPYTQLIFTTDVEDVFSLEEKVSEAIDGNYAVYIDRFVGNYDFYEAYGRAAENPDWNHEYWSCFLFFWWSLCCITPATYLSMRG